ncbi:MAG: hypothetical protein AAGF79_15110, partial [Pseudomonadota bacterium]
MGYCDIVESVRLYDLYGTRLGELWESVIESFAEAPGRCEVLTVEGDAFIYATPRAADVADIALELQDRLGKEQIDG